MKTIVTGGAGFIGSNLVKRLLEEGHEVHVVDNLLTGDLGKVPKGALFHEMDVRNTEDIGMLFHVVQPDVVFHLAARPRVQYSIDHPLETDQINVFGTLSVLNAALAAGTSRVVYSSSSSVYGAQARMPLVETMAPAPISPYGAQKLMGEIYCRVYSRVHKLETVCLRYFNVYGPNMLMDGAYSTVIGIFLSQMRAGLPFTITGDGKNRRAFTHVSDVVEANVLAADLNNKGIGRGEAINIGSEANYSINEVADMMDPRRRKEYVAARLEPKETKANIVLAWRKLGWMPQVDMAFGLRKLKELQ